MTIEWVPQLGLGLSFSIDGLSAAMLVLVVAASAPILAWTLRSGSRDGRLAVLLGTFVVAIAGLFTAADTLTLFIAWEVTSVLSYLLVGMDGGPAARRAARSTLLVTGAGGVALLVGMLLLGGGLSAPLSALSDLDATSPAVVAGAWLVLFAAMTKSAQVPFHGWLTGAWTAPTAASALLHAATLVVAGVYLVARIAPGAAGVPGWTSVAMAIGLATFVWCQWAAVRAAKAKTLLASTTSAQLGLALAAAASGTSRGIAVAVGLLLVHGAYKAALFLTVGNVTARTGRGDVDGLWDGTSGDRWLRAALLLGAATLAGVPPLAGWATKEAAVAWALGVGSRPAVAAVAVGSALGVVVAARLVGLVRTPDPNRTSNTNPALRPDPDPALRPTTDRATGRLRPTPSPPRTTGIAALAPLSLLVAVAVLGVATGPLDALADRAAVGIVGGDGAKLVLWPGLGTALTVSLAAIGLGVLAVASRRRSGTASVERTAPELLARTVDLGLRRAGVVARTVEDLDRRAVVGIVTAGVLGTMLAVVDPTAVPLTGLPLATGPLQLVAGVIVIVAALGVVLLRRRLAAAIVLGVVGYGLAGLFAVHGAPDLVLTQVVVETVVVIAFVGVLGRRARAVPRRATGTLQGAGARLLVAVGAGALAAELALRPALTGGPRELADLATAAAEPVGAGSNIVNVILTDFRALDTVGELAVLAMAALAALPLLRRMVGRAAAGLGEPISPMLSRAAPMLTRVAVVVGLHLLLVGHDAPGGGFVAGLTIGAGLALHQLATGRLPRRVERVWPVAWLGAGMVVATTAVLAPMLAGRAPGDMGSMKLRLGALAEPKLTTALAFDVGVVLLVVGVVVVTLRTLRPGHLAPSLPHRPSPHEPWIDLSTMDVDASPDASSSRRAAASTASRPTATARTADLTTTEPS